MVSQVVVVGLEKQWLLLLILHQLLQTQQVMLGELTTTLLVRVYTTDTVPVETSSTVLFRLSLLRTNCLIRLRLFLVGEAEGRLLGEGEGGDDGAGGTDQSGKQVESVDHYNNCGMPLIQLYVKIQNQYPTLPEPICFKMNENPFNHISIP